jgi:NAD(P)-dependent dehydrogenase (short-subunit alcohol dehydrogenase family)
MPGQVRRFSSRCSRPERFARDPADAGGGKLQNQLPDRRDDCLRELGSIDILVNNAGIVRRPDLLDYSDGTLGRPEDLATSVLFLAVEGSGYVTGITVPVDGGWLVR